MRRPKGGYHIFYAISKEDFGFEKVANDLQDQIKEAELEHDLVFLSGPSFKDDPGGRSVFFGSQAAVLTPKVGKKI
jgi:hypothetical protein